MDGQVPSANSGNEGEPVCFDGYVDNFMAAANRPGRFRRRQLQPDLRERRPLHDQRPTPARHGLVPDHPDRRRLHRLRYGNGFAVQVVTLNTGCPPAVFGGNVNAPSGVPSAPLPLTGPGTFVIFVSRDNGLTSARCAGLRCSLHAEHQRPGHPLVRYDPS